MPPFIVSILILVGTLALSGYAAAMVRRKFARWSEYPALSGMTGAQAAEVILRRAGIFDVEVVPHQGMLSDHYDPVNRRLALSEGVYASRSVAALGVAAHEAGHAMQHATGYAPLHWRMGAVKLSITASWAVMIAPLALSLIGKPLLGAGVAAACMGVLMLFNLITLPVEFDASRRAKAVLAETGIIRSPEEAHGVNQVLNAAGFTYVAAFITSLAYLLQYLLPLLMGRTEEE